MTSGFLGANSFTFFTNGGPTLPTGLITGTVSGNYIPYADGSNTLANSGLYWDNSNTRLGIGTASPQGLLHIDGGASITRMIIDADNNIAKILSFRTNAVQRWAFRVDGDETGSNAASDLYLRSYTDAGALLNTVMYFKRSTGNVVVNNTVDDGTNKFQVTGTGIFSDTVTGRKFIATDTTDDGGTTTAGFSVQRTLSASVDANGHGFKDNTLFTRENRAYNAFDALPTITVGSADHVVSFQSRPSITSTGTISNVWGYWNEFTIAGAGTVTNAYALYAANPLGGGTITNNYGLYVVAQSAGGYNRAIYTAGTTASYFGGTIYVTGNVGVGKADGAALTQALDVTGGIAFTTDVRGDSDNFYYSATNNNLSIGKAAAASSSYSIHTANQIRSDVAFLGGDSGGSYNCYYLNGAGGNFGTVQRTDTNKWSLGYDGNIGLRLGTPVLTWTSAGNVLINTTTDNGTDQLQVRGNVNLTTAGNKLKIATGANASVGTSTLVSGTVTVNTTAVTTNSIIYVTYNTVGGTLDAGLAVPAASIVNGTSFVINSLTAAGGVNTADTSTVNWWIIN
jgi:hypothetical protein